MYEELINRIKELRCIDKEHVPDDETIEDWVEMSSHNNTRNNTIDKIISLIDTYKPIELVIPDSPGAYLRFVDKWIATQVYKDVNNNLFIIELDGLKWQNLYKLEGRWIKIELPKQI
jgi:hypothetical protein